MRNASWTLLVTFVALGAYGADAPKRSVFIHATCDGKLSSVVINSLKAEIDTSQKYHLVPNLTDEGRFEEVLTVVMACSERTDAASFATAYGKAKCAAGGYCYQGVDGGSLRSIICDSNATVECGRTIFKMFDGYVSHLPPSAPQNQSH